MRSGTLRGIPAVVLLAASVALAGCATSPRATEGAPTTATPTASASPTAVAPTEPSATASTPAPPTPSENADAASAPSAADVCIERHEETMNPADGERFTGEPVVYERSLDPRWLVVIPAENNYASLTAECIVSDSDSGPRVESTLTMVADQFDDEHLQFRLNTNDGGA